MRRQNASGRPGFRMICHGSRRRKRALEAENVPKEALAGSRLSLEKLERAKGFEPSTPTLVTFCSALALTRTPWIADEKPAPDAGKRISQGAAACQHIATMLKSCTNAQHVAG